MEEEKKEKKPKLYPVMVKKNVIHDGKSYSMRDNPHKVEYSIKKRFKEIGAI